MLALKTQKVKKLKFSHSSAQLLKIKIEMLALSSAITDFCGQVLETDPTILIFNIFTIE